MLCKSYQRTDYQALSDFQRMPLSEVREPLRGQGPSQL